MLERRIIGMPPPERLGILRAVIIFSVLQLVLWEPFQSIAEAPLNWYRPPGFMMFLPGQIMNALIQSETSLLLFKMVLIACLVSAMIGFKTQISLILSTLLLFIFEGVVRSYAWFFHVGLVPLQLMAFMCFLPVGDAFSLDARKNQSKGQLFYSRTSRTIGWSVFLLRAVVAFAYFQAGYAKLTNTGWEWLAPWNLKRHVVEDSMLMMHFDFDLGLKLMYLPDTFWGFLAFAAVFSELLYPLVLVSWNLRQIFPILAVGLHSSILLMQNIFFPDLILLQLIFYDWDRIFRKRTLTS